MKDELTRRVLDTYQRYPFPNHDYRMPYGLAILRWLRQFELSRPGFWSQASVMEAGCGTGTTICNLASLFPEASFLGVDLTPESLKLATERASKMGLDNIRFEVHDLNNLDLVEDDEFDVILCIGVLHHTSDMARCLNELKKCLKPDGYILLWLYGKHGRYRLNCNQKMLERLFQNVHSLEEKVELTRIVLMNGRQEDLSCHFNVPMGEIENDWLASRDFVLSQDQWLVDQFLHPNEQVVDLGDILNLSEGAGMTLFRWLGVSEDITKLIPSDVIGELFDALPKFDKLKILDYLLKPDYYTVVFQIGN